MHLHHKSDGRDHSCDDHARMSLRQVKVPACSLFAQPALAEPLAEALALTDTLIDTEALAWASSEAAKQPPTFKAAAPPAGDRRLGAFASNLDGAD